jgi:hypothetical protein
MTGSPFPFTPAAQDPSPVSGEVRESVGHHPASFQIVLKDTYWYLKLYAKPSQFDSNLPLLVDEAQWTITPDWNPSLVKTLRDTEPENRPKGFLVGQVQLPAPAPGQVDTVRIQLQLKCRALYTGGYLPGGWYVLPGPIQAVADPVTVAYSGSNVTVTWKINLETYADQNGDKHPMVHATKQSVT